MTSDGTQFADLYRRYHRSVYAYCRRRTTGDRAEDAVAETFLVAWRKIDELPDGEQALAWLYGVAYRVLGHQWRGQARRRQLDKKLSSVGIDSAPPADDPIIVRAEQSQVREATNRLKPAEIEILRLAIWEELPQADIAIALDISIDAVRQRLSRARKRLTQEYNRLEKKRTSPPAAQKGGGR